MRSIKHECLNRTILFAVGHLRTAIDEYITHYNHERNHQGIGNELTKVGLLAPRGPVEYTERLGGLLRFYRRAG